MPHTTNKTLAQAERIMLVSVLLSRQYTGSNQTRERSFQAACACYFTIWFNSPLAYFAAIFSSETGLILSAIPSQPNA